MLSTILWPLAISLAINGAMFLVAFWRSSDKLTDASYAVSFIVLAIWAFLHSGREAYDAVGTALVCLWALRIGSFLLYRVIRAGSDHRFDGMREHFLKFGKFWLGQAFTVWALMIPATLALTGDGTPGLLIYIGAAIWLAGFGIESIADLQKYRFTHNPAHKGRWIESGLWRYSRHPNYFGEITVWLGIYLYAFSHLSTAGRLVGLVSPLFIAVLLLYISGIPILENNADMKWGEDPAYQKYKKRTSLLIPLPRNQLRV